MASMEYPSCEFRPPQTQKTLAPMDVYLELQASREIIKALEEKLGCQAAEIEEAKRKLVQETTERLKVEHVLETERVQLKHHSYHDALTQLANRKLLIERIEQSFQRIKTQKNTQIAVLLIDLDRFRVVNDSLGYSAGDRILVIIAQHLKSLLRSTDTVARLGGDEFALLLEPIQQQGDAIHCAKRIIQALQLPLQAEGKDIFITPSIGIVIGTSEYDQPADLLRDADIAMYYAKNSGKARYAMFSQEMYTQILTQQQMEQDLRQAIEQQQLHICFQPIICLHTNKLIGFEALVRWNHPVQGIIPPCHFIPLAEETGLIIPLGEWVLKATCEYFVQWQTDIELPDNFKISINISIKQLQYPQFLKQIARILKQTGISGERLRLELTESVFMDNPEFLILLLTKLRGKGIELSIDDFGTGYSSLSYLHRLPVNYLKIDQSFISSLGQGEENLAIVSTILTLSRQSGLGAIAEGVETPEQLECLQTLGCDAAQGYLFAKALPQQLAKRLLQLAFSEDVPTPWVHLQESLSGEHVVGSRLLD